MKNIQNFFQDKDRFAQLAGIEILETKAGFARTKVDITDMHKNGVDIAHGGLIFTLADMAFSVASNSHGTVALAINASIQFIRPGTGKTLFATAEETSCGKKLATYNVQVMDDQNRLIATFQGMVYRKKDKIQDLDSSK